MEGFPGIRPEMKEEEGHAEEKAGRGEAGELETILLVPSSHKLGQWRQVSPGSGRAPALRTSLPAGMLYRPEFG